jgi:hypothetical protein
MSLRRKLAEHGFESNDDYEHAIRCLLGQPGERLRVLHVDGLAGRRKTAFAQALGAALAYPKVLYHDFGDAGTAPTTPAQPTADVAGPTDAALGGFERALTEACAYSEAEPTMLILDQLQEAAFAEHLRLHRFAESREWTNALGTVQANPRNFLLVLVSEQPLYHSLARCSFRVWTDAQRAWQDFRPPDYGMGPEATPLFEALSGLFESLAAAPTPTEFGHLLDDLMNRVRSEEMLRQSVFGRVESIDRSRLYSPDPLPMLRRVLDEVERLLGAEHVELGT